MRDIIPNPFTDEPNGPTDTRSLGYTTLEYASITVDGPNKGYLYCSSFRVNKGHHPGKFKDDVLYLDQQLSTT